MSTSLADSDDRFGEAARSLSCAKDEGLVNALSSVPNFPFVDATSHPASRKDDHQPQPATASPLEMATGSDVGAPPKENQSQRPWSWPPARRRRRGHKLRKLLVGSAISAMVGGALVLEISMLIDDEGSGFPDLLKLASDVPSTPKATPSPTEYSAIVNLEKAERMAPATSLQPAVSLRVAAQLEKRPTESEIEVASPQTVPGFEYGKVAGETAATPESPLTAKPEPTPVVTLEPPPIAAPASIPIAMPDPPEVETPQPLPTAMPQPIATSQSAPIAMSGPPAVDTPALLPAATPQPITTSESRPIATADPVAATPLPSQAATQPPNAAAESTAIARLEPAPERLPIPQAPSQIKNIVGAALLPSGRAEARQARYAASTPEADLLVRSTKCIERGIPFKAEGTDLYLCWDENADALWNLLDRRRRKGDLSVEVKGDNARGLSLSLGSQYCFKWPDEGGYRACVVSRSQTP